MLMLQNDVVQIVNYAAVPEIGIGIENGDER